MGTATLTNAVAVGVSAVSPTANYDSSLGINLRTGGTGDLIGYLYFARPFPLGATILSAKIKLYSLAMTTGTHTINLVRLNQTFAASKVTYNTRPTAVISGTIGVTKSGVLAAGVEWEFDITTWMQTVANGGVWYGVEMKSIESTARVFYSEIHPLTQYRPRFEVTWNETPSTPGGLAPSGGRAVGLAKPVVRATYIDVSGSSGLQSIQVQINATDTWGAPTFDSGTVATSVPELDLNTTAYAGLADGSTTFWRVRFQNLAGIWSPYSVAASFKRDDKGTLAVSNPPSGTPVVEDATPPIIWALTGETQAAYQLLITHTVNGAIVRDWDSGKVTSTAVSATVPAGAITQTGVTYTVTVRVWDTDQREATPGDPTYVEVVRNFTFVPGATTGTTALTAIPQDPKPVVRLFWTRATAPDKFNLVRNGKIIEAGIDPVDALISGTSYTWTDNAPAPGRSLTYSVQAVVNNVASATNSSAVCTVRSSGIWLREPVTGLELCIMGAADRDFTLGEQGAALQSIALNANKVVINQSLGGLEGRIEGELTSIYTKTAQQWRDIYFQMRALRVKKFYLTVGDYTFLAVCQGFAYGQRGFPEPQFKVGFDFYQQDDVASIVLGS